MNINISSIPTIRTTNHELGPANPWLIYIAKETLDFRRSDFSSDLRLLGPTFSLPNAPEALTGPPSLRLGMLFYHAFQPKLEDIRTFGIRLSPVKSSAHSPVVEW